LRRILLKYAVKSVFPACEKIVLHENGGFNWLNGIFFAVIG